MADKMSKETQEKISQLQMMEQALQNSLMQKQQLNSQKVEIDSALKELKDTTKSFKIIGNLMIATDKKDLETELNKKKETIELRLETIEKQESRFKEKTKSMQEEIMKEMQG